MPSDTPAAPGLTQAGHLFRVRLAEEDDLPAVVALHAANPFGHGDVWSEAMRATYQAALARMHATPGHALHVAEWDGQVVGTFVLSLLPGITRGGALLAELRSVQVAAPMRSQGIGRRMVEAAEALARAAGAATMELTSNLGRLEAHRFYEREGYVRSHAGFKKVL